MDPRVKKIKEQTPEELEKFLKAGKVFGKIQGISISSDQRAFERIKKILDFTPKTPEGKQVKKGMLGKARAESRKGIFGDGVFLLDD